MSCHCSDPVFLYFWNVICNYLLALLSCTSTTLHDSLHLSCREIKFVLCNLAPIFPANRVHTVGGVPVRKRGHFGPGKQRCIMENAWIQRLSSPASPWRLVNRDQGDDALTLDLPKNLHVSS